MRLLQEKDVDDIELDTWTVRHLEEHARADEGGAADVDDLADGWELRELAPRAARRSVSDGWELDDLGEREIFPERAREPGEASAAPEGGAAAAAERLPGEQRGACGSSTGASGAGRTGGERGGAAAAGPPAVWDPGLGAGQEAGLEALGEAPQPASVAAGAVEPRAHLSPAAAGDVATADAGETARPDGQRDVVGAEPRASPTRPLAADPAQGPAQGLAVRASKLDGGAAPAPPSPDSQAAAALASPARSFVRVEKGFEDEQEGPSTPPSCEPGASAGARSPLRPDAALHPSSDRGSNPSTSPSSPTALPPWTPRRSSCQGSRSPRAARVASPSVALAPGLAAALVPERLPPLPCAEAGSAEAEFSVAFINARLGGDPELAQRLPLSGGAAALLPACRDGVLLWCATDELTAPAGVAAVILPVFGHMGAMLHAPE